MEYPPQRRCGAVPAPDGSTSFRVWAPRAGRVELALIDNSGRRLRIMEQEAHGFFHCLEHGVPEGRRYAFILDGGPERPDPASLWQPDGVHKASAVVHPNRFAWTDTDWRGVGREDLVFYELHVGTFTPEGTFEAIIPRLDSLRELGVTALELMPVGQFPGERNWGYDGVFPYAVQHSYGGPQGLCRLVDACHRAGLAVVLDVIYNHLGPEGNYFWDFGPYFTDRYRTGWGPAFNYDGAGSDAVRDFVLDNARMWIDEYHLDGLRLDAVHAIYDFSARHLLRALKEVVDVAGRRVGRQVHVIAESDLNDPRLLWPVERGGYGLDAQWSDDFHHCVHSYLANEQQGYYEDFGKPEQLAQVLASPFLYAGTYSRHRDRKHGASPDGLSGDRFVVSIQNHDQIGNRASGDRLASLLRPAAQRLASSLLLLAPHLPLLFMGEEYGEENPFAFFCSFEDADLIRNVREGRRKEFAAFAWQAEVPDPQAESTFAAARLSWSWPEGTHRDGLRRLYGDLLRARKEWPALRDYTNRTVRLVGNERSGPVLEYLRGAPGQLPASFIHIYCNLSEHAQKLPPGSVHKLLFSSEARRYTGARDWPGSIVDLLPFECVVLESNR